MALEETGFITWEELGKYERIPSEKRFNKGPVAVVECIQQIPCNPCEAACKQEAIKIGEPITKLPVLNEERCTGCGLCIAKCPGLAIFVVDKAYSDLQATVAFPYEYTPLPKANQAVTAVNRQGEVVCDAMVLKVVNPKAYDKTPVVTVAIPKKYADEVRSIKRLR